MIVTEMKRSSEMMKVEASSKKKKVPSLSAISSRSRSLGLALNKDNEKVQEISHDSLCFGCIFHSVPKLAVSR